MITPAQEDIEIFQGATWQRKYTWQAGEPATGVDITGAEVRMQVRPSKRSDTVFVNASTVSGEITLTDAPNGEFTIRLEASTTDDLSFSRAVYDIEIEMTDGTVYRLVEGDACLSREVTRPVV